MALGRFRVVPDQRGAGDPHSEDPVKQSWRVGAAPSKLRNRVLYLTPNNTGRVIRYRTSKQSTVDTAAKDRGTNPTSVETSNRAENGIDGETEEEDLEERFLNDPEFRQAVYQALMAFNQPQASVRNTIFDTFQTAGSTADEKNGVFRYLQYAPAIAFGSTGKGLFCPTRDLSWPVMQNYRAGLGWPLMHSECLLWVSRGIPFSPTFHQRKAKLYQHISELLGKPEMQTSDIAIAWVCAAMVLETHSPNPENNRAHLKGLAKIIETRGIRSLFSVIAFRSHPMFCLGHFALAEFEVSNIIHARYCSKKFFGTLIAMQRFVQSQVGDDPQEGDEWVDWENCASATTSSCADLPPGDSTGKGPWSNMNCEALLHPFASDLLTIPGKDDTILKQHCRFLCIYLTNLILFDCRDFPSEGQKFLQRYTDLMSSSFAVDSRTGHRAWKADTVAWMLAKAWTDVDATSHRESSGSDKEVYMTEAGMDSLKVFSRLRNTSKDKVAGVLASWLLGSNIRYLSDFDLRKMQIEACSDWYERSVNTEVLRSPTKKK